MGGQQVGSGFLTKYPEPLVLFLWDPSKEEDSIGSQDIFLGIGVDLHNLIIVLITVLW